jgi:hypothetical protein
MVLRQNIYSIRFYLGSEYTFRFVPFFCTGEFKTLSDTANASKKVNEFNRMHCYLPPEDND